MKKATTASHLFAIATAALLVACGDPAEPTADKTVAVTPHPAIAAVLSETSPAGAVSVVAARKTAKPGQEIVVEGIIAGALAPFAEGFASVVVGDLAIETCDKIPGDSCPTPWDACCADPGALKGMRLTLQVSGGDGRPVPQSLKGISGLKEMDQIVAVGTVAADSTPENLILQVSRLHRRAMP